MDGHFIALWGSAQQELCPWQRHATTTLSSFVSLICKKAAVVAFSLTFHLWQEWMVNERPGLPQTKRCSARHIALTEKSRARLRVPQQLGRLLHSLQLTAGVVGRSWPHLPLTSSRVTADVSLTNRSCKFQMRTATKCEIAANLRPTAPTVGSAQALTAGAPSGASYLWTSCMPSICALNA